MPFYYKLFDIFHNHINLINEFFTINVVNGPAWSEEISFFTEGFEIEAGVSVVLILSHDNKQSCNTFVNDPVELLVVVDMTC